MKSKMAHGPILKIEHTQELGPGSSDHHQILHVDGEIRKFEFLTNIPKI